MQNSDVNEFVIAIARLAVAGDNMMPPAKIELSIDKKTMSQLLYYATMLNPAGGALQLEGSKIKTICGLPVKVI